MPDYQGFPCLIERLIIYFNVYTKLVVMVWNEHQAVLSMRQNLIFSVVTWSIWFKFCFRLNIFTSKSSNLLLPAGADRRGEWIFIYLRLENYKTRSIHEPCHIYHPGKTILESIMNRFKKFIEKSTADAHILMTQYDVWCNI